MAYEIKPGDTIEGIAAFFGLTVEQLNALNPQGYSGAGSVLKLSPNDSPGRGLGSDMTESATILYNQQQESTSAPVDTSGGYGRTTKVEGSTAPGLLKGGKVFQIERPGLPDTYAYAFEYPLKSGNYVSWEFDSLDQIEAAIGKDWFKTVPYSKTSLKAYDENFTVMSDIGAITGMTGNFYSMMSAAGMEAAAEAGINDPTLLGQILNDPEMQSIMAQDTFGDLSDTQVMAMKRNTNFWKNVLYPGIENLYSTTADPETAWNNYTRSVEDSLVALGVPRDADGTYKSQVGKMLTQKVEDSTFNELAPTFVRAANSPQYADTLNQWTQRELGKPLDFDNWFNVLAGEAEPDLLAVVEKAGLQYQAEQQGLQLSTDQISKIAEQADLSEQGAAEAFATYEQILTSLAGTLGNDPKYAITQDEILSLATGIKPDSGRSTEEIRKYAAQAAREAGALDDQKLQFFVGYDPVRGTPNRPGLNPLAPESA
jgi:hypothetical protein